MKRESPTLAAIVLTAGSRDRLAADCARLAESRMARRGGLSGMAVKAGLALLKKARPDILERATARMLPDMLAALEPLHVEYAADRTARRGGFDAYLTARGADATAALLKVSDARAAASVNITARSLYARLRGSAEQEVRDAMPELAAILARYVE
ncbi:MAG: hypothetical protein ISP90_16455 [Nevskia sp.]|nr:hypothetical protein [Nevskia sp.]